MQRLLACLLILGVAGCRTTALESWMVGQLELEAGNLDAAVTQLEYSKRRDPDFAPAYLALAAACSKKGDFVAVAENLQTYLKLNPEHRVAHVYLAECLLSLHQREKAKGHYLQFVQATPSDNEREQERLAHCCERLARIAVDEHDEFEGNLYAGLALYHQGRCVQKRATVANGDGADTSSLDSGADPVSLRANELFVRALARLQAAKSENANDPRVRRSLACVLTAMGDKDAAERLGSVEERTATPLESLAFPGAKKSAAGELLSMESLRSIK